MEPEEIGMQRPPRYEGEDTKPTSERELMGWYAYGLAAEVFAVCGVGGYALLSIAIGYVLANRKEQVCFFLLR